MLSGWTGKDKKGRPKWRPGQLIGENGSDPDVIAKSPSVIPSDQWDNLTEQQSLTSTGHIFQYQRPSKVSVGWGGYDQLTQWQSYGPQVTEDMVAKASKIDWKKDPLGDIPFVDEDGNLTITVKSKLTLDDIDVKDHPLLTIGKLFAKRRETAAAKEHKAPRQPALKWPGQRN